MSTCRTRDHVELKAGSRWPRVPGVRTLRLFLAVVERARLRGVAERDSQRVSDPTLLIGYPSRPMNEPAGWHRHPQYDVCEVRGSEP